MTRDNRDRAAEDIVRSTNRHSRLTLVRGLVNGANNPDEVKLWLVEVCKWLEEYRKCDPEGATDLAAAVIATFQGFERPLDAMPPRGE